MWDNIVGRNIGRVNRNLALVNLLILLGLAALAYGSRQYLGNCLHGPYPTTAAQLTAPTPIHPFAAISGDQTIDTGGTEVDHDSGDTTAHFLILRLGHRILLVKAPRADENQRSYSGTLTPISGAVWDNIVAPVERRVPQTAQMFLPVMLDATAFYRENAYIGLALGLPLALLCLWNLRKVAQRLRHPDAHPMARALARYGDPESVAHRIQQDCEGETEKIGGATLSPNWLLYPTLFGFQAVEIPSLVWTYRKVTTTKYWGVIPIRKSHAAKLLDRHGRNLEIHAGKKKVEALLARLQQRAPWALTGFSAKLQAAARTNLAEIVKAVDERRREAEAARA